MYQDQPSLALVLYMVDAHTVSALWVGPDGAREDYQLGSLARFLPRVEQVQDEVHDSMAVARGRVPHLTRFVQDWGAALLPEPMFSTRPEVLVITPHAFLHDLPLHLVCDSLEGLPLCAHSGVTYCSSMTLFDQCRLRNRRWRNDESCLGTQGGERGHSLVGRAADVMTGDHDRFLKLMSGLAACFEDVDVSSDAYLASRLGVKAALLGPADAICLAAHGHVDLIDERLSGVLLPAEPPGVAFNRGIDVGEGVSIRYRDLPFAHLPVNLRPRVATDLLTGAELEVETSIEASLVILLACSAGAGLVRDGDEPASIAEMLLRMGAASVLAAGWDVDAGFAAQFVRHFVTGWLENGYPKALAHRFAVRESIAEGWGERPERLGAFMLRGDWL